MHVVVRLIEQRDVATGRAVDTPFDPIVFDGDLDIDPIQDAYRHKLPVDINGNRYIVSKLQYNSVVGETVVEVEVEPAR
ncbi:MAG TPA: hypothetical protein VHL09_16545 [Dehalococcoidia bacterium]|nr:hypothetical protein [Dehalococcoidia bacterium]